MFVRDNTIYLYNYSVKCICHRVSWNLLSFSSYKAALIITCHSWNSVANEMINRWNLRWQKLSLFLRTCFKLFSMVLWRAHVTINPDDRKIREFIRGSMRWFIVFTVGSFLWIILLPDLSRTHIDILKVLFPSKFLSRMISCHHKIIIILVISILNNNKLILYVWNLLINQENSTIN